MQITNLKPIIPMTSRLEGMASTEEGDGLFDALLSSLMPDQESSELGSFEEDELIQSQLMMGALVQSVAPQSIDLPISLDLQLDESIQVTETGDLSLLETPKVNFMQWSVLEPVDFEIQEREIVKSDVAIVNHEPTLELEATEEFEFKTTDFKREEVQLVLEPKDETYEPDEVKPQKSSTDNEIQTSTKAPQESMKWLGSEFGEMVQMRQSTATETIEPTLIKSEVSAKWENQVEVMTEIEHRISLLKEEDSTTLTLKLYPKTLGNISVEMNLKNGVLNAQVLLEHAELKPMIEQAMHQVQLDGFANVQVNVEVGANSQSFFKQQDEQSANKNSRYVLDEDEEGAEIQLVETNLMGRLNLKV